MVRQFLNAQTIGPIGMSEEKDAGQAQRELAEVEGEMPGLPDLKPQLKPSSGLPERKAVSRRMDRVMGVLHSLPSTAQDAIRAGFGAQRRRDEGGRDTAGEIR